MSGFHNEFMITGRVAGELPMRLSDDKREFQPVFVNTPFTSKDGRRIENQLYLSCSGKVALRAKDMISDGDLVQFKGVVLTTTFQAYNGKVMNVPRLKFIYFKIIEKADGSLLPPP